MARNIYKIGSRWSDIGDKELSIFTRYTSSSILSEVEFIGTNNKSQY